MRKNNSSLTITPFTIINLPNVQIIGISSVPALAITQGHRLRKLHMQAHDAAISAIDFLFHVVYSAFILT